MSTATYPVTNSMSTFDEEDTCSEPIHKDVLDILLRKYQGMLVNHSYFLAVPGNVETNEPSTRRLLGESIPDDFDHKQCYYTYSQISLKTTRGLFKILVGSSKILQDLGYKMSGMPQREGETFPTIRDLNPASGSHAQSACGLQITLDHEEEWYTRISLIFLCDDPKYNTLRLLALESLRSDVKTAILQAASFKGEALHEK